MARQTITPLNYYSARALIQLFDSCYQMGVEDAVSENDVFKCEQWVKEKYAPCTFSRITWGYDVSWQEWKFRLSQMIRAGQNRVLGTRFFDSISSYSSYYAAALPIAMDFYLQGIQDYCKRPNSNEWVLFKSKTYVRWGKNNTTKVNTDDVIREVTDFCFNRTRLDEALYKATDKQGKIALTHTAYNNFYRQLWAYTRKVD